MPTKLTKLMNLLKDTSVSIYVSNIACPRHRLTIAISNILKFSYHTLDKMGSANKEKHKDCFQL
jgi:hypothetical protein